MSTAFFSSGFNSHREDPHADDPIEDREDADDGYDLTAEECYLGMWDDDASLDTSETRDAVADYCGEA